MRDATRRASHLRILMLEDSALDAELITAQLQRAGLDFEIERLWTRDAFIEAIESDRFDVILADHVLPGFDGDAALDLARERAPQIPFIFVSGTLTEELAVQALTRGARDYVVKQRLQRLPDAIRRARQEASERSQLAHARAALDESQAQLQQITDAVPALIAHLDTDHRYRFANKAFLDWHGADLQGILGRTAAEIGGEEAFANALPSLQRVLAGERASFQTTLVHRSGESRFVQMDCVPERAADGSITGYTCLGSDVSSLKRAELALREDNESLERQVQARTAELQGSKRRLQAIFESSFQHQVLSTRLAASSMPMLPRSLRYWPRRTMSSACPSGSRRGLPAPPSLRAWSSRRWSMPRRGAAPCRRWTLNCQPATAALISPSARCRVPRVR